MTRHNILAALILIVSVEPYSTGWQAQKSTELSKARVYFSALDKSEKPVLDLSPLQFQLRINRRSVPMDGFRPGLPHTDHSIPLALWILIDWNPIIGINVIKGQADAAAKAFDLFNPDSVIGIQLVSDRAEILEPLEHNPAGVRRAFADFSRRRNELHVGSQHESAKLGAAGILGAVNSAIDSVVSFCREDPALKDREVHRAIMIISCGNVNPSYGGKDLYEKAAGNDVFLYPVFIPPSGRIGFWLEYYFELARKTGGVASVFGALSPGSEILHLKRGSTGVNALTFNFLHLARDLNGKYSFEVEVPSAGRGASLDLKVKGKQVEIRLPRKNLP